MGKKRVIVYGLGDAYQEQKCYLEDKFSIIGYSDTYMDMNSVRGDYTGEYRQI